MNTGCRLCLFFVLFVACNIVRGQSKTLAEYIDLSLANSPELKEEYAKIEISKIDSSIATTNYKPQVNFNGQALIAPTYGIFGYDQAISNGGAYEAVVSATQLITPRKEIKLNRTNSEYTHQLLSIEGKRTENELKRNVTDKYLNICLLQQQQDFFCKSDSFLIMETKTLKVLADKGIYKISDYYQLMVEEQSERVEIAKLKLEIGKAFTELNEICGINDTSNKKLTVPHIEKYKQSDPTQLLEYKKLQFDSLQLTNQQALLDAQYNPHLSWYADAGIEASQPNLIYRSFGNSLGLNLNIPIYDGHRRILKHKSIGISENIRFNYEQFYSKTYSAHIVAITNQMENTNQLVQQLNNEETLLLELMKINNAELSTGNISITDYLISLKKELDVKNDLAQATITQQLLQNEFNYWNN